MIKLLEVSKGAFRYYRENVSGNEHTSYAQVQRKLTRNMMLAYKHNSEGYDGQMYYYGKLCFVVRNNRVVWIMNKAKLPEGAVWSLDMKKYIRLSQELGIDEYDSRMDKVKKDVIVKTKRAINKVKWSIKDKLNKGVHNETIESN